MESYQTLSKSVDDIGDRLDTIDLSKSTKDAKHGNVHRIKDRCHCEDTRNQPLSCMAGDVQIQHTFNRITYVQLLTPKPISRNQINVPRLVSALNTLGCSKTDYFVFPGPRQRGILSQSEEYISRDSYFRGEVWYSQFVDMDCSMFVIQAFFDAQDESARWKLREETGYRMSV